MASYDTLEDKAGYLGTRIKTGVPSQAYKDNYDRIFRANEMNETDELIENKNIIHKLKTQSGSNHG
jgi:hypothetical protein